MKYIRTNGLSVYGKNEINRDYLINVKETGELLINIESGEYFDTDSNTWVNIPSD